MKMRQHKHNVLARMMFNNWYDGIMASLCQPIRTDGRIIFYVETPSPLGELLAKRLREEEIQKVEEAKQEFVCVKVKGGDVVDTFDTREDALALVNKHIKGKKAKLQVIDSSTGELVLFAESEMA